MNDPIHVSDSDEDNIPKKVNVLQNIQIRPAIAPSTSSQGGMSFEERVLKELSDLKKAQETFEARIEMRIETFFDDQSRMQGSGQYRMQGNSHSQMQENGQSRMQANDQPRIQYQNRQYGGFRNEIQIRHREPVSPERYIHDFEDFEELDQNFPVHIQSNVEVLEYKIRRDLEFKFLLVIYLFI